MPQSRTLPPIRMPERVGKRWPYSMAGLPWSEASSRYGTLKVTAHEPAPTEIERLRAHYPVHMNEELKLKSKPTEEIEPKPEPHWQASKAASQLPEEVKLMIYKFLGAKWSLSSDDLSKYFGSVPEGMKQLAESRKFDLKFVREENPGYFTEPPSVQIINPKISIKRYWFREGVDMLERCLGKLLFQTQAESPSQWMASQNCWKAKIIDGELQLTGQSRKKVNLERYMDKKTWDAHKKSSIYTGIYVPVFYKLSVNRFEQGSRRIPVEYTVRTDRGKKVYVWQLPIKVEIMVEHPRAQKPYLCGSFKTKCEISIHDSKPIEL